MEERIGGTGGNDSCKREGDTVQKRASSTSFSESTRACSTMAGGGGDISVDRGAVVLRVRLATVCARCDWKRERKCTKNT